MYSLLRTGTQANFRWSFIWNLKIPPKIKVFIWKVCKNILPTKTFLHSRLKNNSISTICRSCNSDQEDIQHIFKSCPRAKIIWTFVDKWWKGVDFQLDDNDWLWKLYTAIKQPQQISQWQTTVSAAIWTLWLSRNEVIFKNQKISDKDLEFLLLHRSFLWCRGGGLVHNTGLDTWKIDPTLAIQNHRKDFIHGLTQHWDYIGFIDGSMKTTNNSHKSGIGGYIVDNKEELCFIFSGPTAATTSLEAETRSLIFLLHKIYSFITRDKKILSIRTPWNFTIM